MAEMGVDITPVSNSLHFQEWHDDGSRTARTLLHNVERRSDTEFIIYVPSSAYLILGAAKTDFYPTTVVENGVHVESIDDEQRKIFAAHAARQSLLIKNFRNSSTREDDARLQLLTERLRRIDPRITAEQRQIFDDIIVDLESVSANHTEIAARYT